MSLFIGGLSFESQELMNQVRIGVLSGSVISGIMGYVSCARRALSKSKKYAAFHKRKAAASGGSLSGHRKSAAGGADQCQDICRGFRDIRARSKDRFDARIIEN